LLSHIESLAGAGAGICVRLEPEPENWRGQSRKFRRVRTGNGNKAETQPEPEPDKKQIGSATQITGVTDIRFNGSRARVHKIIQHGTRPVSGIYDSIGEIFTEREPEPEPEHESGLSRKI
jgi:hypothetical protein